MSMGILVSFRPLLLFAAQLVPLTAMLRYNVFKQWQAEQRQRLRRWFSSATVMLYLNISVKRRVV